MNNKELGTMSNKETSEIYAIRSSNDSKDVELFFNNKEAANRCCDFLNKTFGTSGPTYYFEEVNVYNVFNFD